MQRENLKNFAAFLHSKDIFFDSSSLIDEYLKSNEVLEIFTDGSCTGNGKINSKGGIGVFYAGNFLPHKSIKYETLYEDFLNLYGIDISIATNNKAELLAIYVALQDIINYKPGSKQIFIYSDSIYSIKCLTEWSEKWKLNNWNTSTGTPVNNKEVIEKILIMLKSLNCVKFKHVKGHKKEPKKEDPDYRLWYGNNQEDILATSAQL